MPGTVPHMARVALRRVAPWIGALLLLAVLGSALVLEARREITDPGNSDAIAFVTGAHLVSSDPQHLYSPQAQERVEARLLDLPLADHFLNPYPNIAAGALLLSPLAHVDLQAATEIAVLTSALLFAVALLLTLRLLAAVASRPVRLAIALAAVLCIPAVEAIFQWDSLMTVALVGSVLLAGRRRYALAGLVLATLILKPQVVWLVVPALVAARSRRYLGGLLVGSAVWIAVSVVITGPHGFVALAQLVAGNYPGQSNRSIGIPSLISAATGSGEVGFIAAGCLGGIAAVLLLWRGDFLRGQPVAAVTIGVVLSLLCSPHVTIEDFMLCVLPIALIARRWPFLALAEAVAISAVEVAQLQLPSGAQHLQPFLLVVIAVSTLLAVRPAVPSTSIGRATDPRLRNRGAGAISA
jgi:Glycosyltransferase family 87